VCSAICVVALDANTGKELWASALSVAKYDGGGDSGTPRIKVAMGRVPRRTIDGGKIYVLDGKLTCIVSRRNRGIKNGRKD
jgi:outer membrane protein assembly factor BamB